MSGWTVAPGKTTIRSTAGVRAGGDPADFLRHERPPTRAPGGSSDRAARCRSTRRPLDGRHGRTQPGEDHAPTAASASTAPPASSQRRRWRRLAISGERVTSMPPPLGVNPGRPPGTGVGVGKGVGRRFMEERWAETKNAVGADGLQGLTGFWQRGAARGGRRQPPCGRRAGSDLVVRDSWRRCRGARRRPTIAANRQANQQSAQAHSPCPRLPARWKSGRASGAGKRCR